MPISSKRSSPACIISQAPPGPSDEDDDEPQYVYCRQGSDPMYVYEKDVLLNLLQVEEGYAFGDGLCHPRSIATAVGLDLPEYLSNLRNFLLEEGMEVKLKTFELDPRNEVYGGRFRDYKECVLAHTPPEANALSSLPHMVKKWAPNMYLEETQREQDVNIVKILRIRIYSGMCCTHRTITGELGY